MPIWNECSYESDYSKITGEIFFEFLVSTKKKTKLIGHNSCLRDVMVQVESVGHIEQYHIKFVETSHYLQRRGCKAFRKSLFSR